MNDNQDVLNFLWILNKTNFRQESNTDSKQQKTKTPLLFVEGVSDIKFLYPLLEATKFEYKGQDITLKIAEANIVSDFINQASEITEKSLIYNQRKYKGPKYEFVSESIKTYENNSKRFNKIDCFGIIDKDFGHNIDDLDNISDTKCHDRETTILRCCFPELIDDCSNKSSALDVLRRIFNVLVKQGIMEEISHTFKEPLLKEPRFKEISHDYFKDNIEDNNVDFLEEDFIEKYLGSFLEKYLDSCYDEYVNREYFLSFYTKVHRKFDDVDKLMDKLPSLLKRWLIDKSTNEEDDKNLDYIFDYCNGHYILQLMCKNKMAFRPEFEKEDDIIRYVLDKVLKGKRKYISLFEMKPFDVYKEYREKNNYYCILQNAQQMGKKK